MVAGGSVGAVTLREVREALGAYASAFDANLLDARAARHAVVEAARIKNMAAVIEAKAAARLAETHTYRERGEKSPAHDLAKLAGVSVGQAAAALEMARRLDDQPEVAGAAARGELSPQQAAAITDALAANPNAGAAPLLATAEKASLGELRAQCERVKAAGDGDAEARRKRIHDARTMRKVRHEDGSEGIAIRDNPERIAAIYAGIAAKRQELFDQARREDRRERADALDLDALIATLTDTTPTGGKGGGGRGGVRAKVLVRVDFDTLLRGYPLDGEVCEIAGYGPIAVSAVRDLLAAGGFLAAIVTKGEKVVGVAHFGRQPRAIQDSALEWIEPMCAREGCPNPWTERDHRLDWADTKITILDALDGLCDHDHDLKTREGWALIDGVGKRPMVPPTDPRHPQHKQRAPQPPGTDPPPKAA